MVTRPSRIHCSTLRREPSPAAASNFCNRIIRSSLEGGDNGLQGARGVEVGD
jgi:hypothetical protein